MNPAIVGAEENFTILAGPAKALEVTGFPTSDTAGTQQSFTVTAVDANGNVATSYVGTVKLSSSDGEAALPANTVITPEDDGSISLTATLNTAGLQSITATDTSTSSITGSESNINVQQAAPMTLVVAGFPATGTAGVAGSLTVTIHNNDGTVATGYTGTVMFSAAMLTPFCPRITPSRR